MRLVSINRAGVKELSTLPGVGRRAAERVVAHRERVGQFGSLDDLLEVEGFTSDRVRRLSERATL
jgi:competence protein ComEA